ncbi:ComC/BlpC family leader-containing pheromone/bacteriocin [Pseudoramibacter sp. HA2172]|nr:ComC/BlpC family leader-containing pheromone/bacteriocin [Pseudoramibacter sp. HA2172]
MNNYKLLTEKELDQVSGGGGWLSLGIGIASEIPDFIKGAKRAIIVPKK